MRSQNKSPSGRAAGSPVTRRSKRVSARRLALSIVVLIVAASVAGSFLALAGDALAQRPQRPGLTQAAPPSGATTAERPAPAAEPSLPGDAVTTHTLTLGQQKFTYTARAGSLALTDGKGQKTAEIFYVAYTRNDENPAQRPLTFALNGGPGAAAAYLDMAAVGPRILDFGDGRQLPQPRATLIDNPDTWLNVTDLVFIDPVGTGYSVASSGDQDAQKNFFGVRQDLDALGAVIHLTLTKLDRYASPIYLLGESYGGFRAARLPLTLASDQGIAVSGTILLSPVLEFSLMDGDDFNPLPWALKLPSYAAVNLERRDALTPQALKHAESFALGDYLAALTAPNADPAAAAPFYTSIAELIGLPEPEVARWRGRVPTGLFVKSIHRDDGQVVSRYDGSVAGPDPDPSAYVANRGDPILAGLTAPLTSGFVAYLRDELQFKTDRRYVLLDGDVGRQWQWGGRGPNSSAGAAAELARALALNPRLKVMIAHGMTDLVTPYLMNRYVIDHMPPGIVRDRVALKLYPGGHMMYLRPGSRAALHADARQLIAPNAD